MAKVWNMSDERGDSKDNIGYTKRKCNENRATNKTYLRLVRKGLPTWEYKDNIRRAKENASHRPLKKFDWSLPRKRTRTDDFSKFSDSFFKRQALNTKQARKLHLSKKVAEFKREKEYLSRMFLGSYVDENENCAKHFMKMRCEYCQCMRHMHFNGLCLKATPFTKDGLRKSRCAMNGVFGFVDHLFTVDKMMTPIVIETLLLEGFQIKEKLQQKIKI